MPQSPSSTKSSSRHEFSLEEIAAERERLRQAARRLRIAAVVICTAAFAVLIVLLVLLIVRPFSGDLDGKQEAESGEVVTEQEFLQEETEEIPGYEEAKAAAQKSEAAAQESEAAARESGEAEEPAAFGTVTAEPYLHVRSGADLDSAVIGHLLPDESVEILDEEDGWYKVVVPEFEGYVFGEYLDVSSLNETDRSEE